MNEASAPPRWRRRPDDRPREILAAALEVFGEQGLAGAKLDEIAARAGLSKATLYHYFPGKDALFRELVRRSVQEATLGALPPDAEGTAVERLRAFMRGFWTRLNTPGFHALYRLVLGELHHFPELTRFYAEEIAGTTVDFVARLVEEGIAAGELRPVDPRAAGRTLIALFTQNALWAGRPELFPHAAGRTDAQVLAEIEDFFFRALRASKD